MEPPKIEQPKPAPQAAAAPRSAPVKSGDAAPSADTVAPPAFAPPPAELPSLDFDGGKTVQSSSDPVQLYKGSLEYALRAKWNRPADAPDDHYVDEVEISVDSSGDIGDPTFKKNSGDSRWDASVLTAIAAVKNIGRAPPPDFPSHIVVRFDVADTEAISP
jgi:outer membrane biosynthesis protein TonB